MKKTILPILILLLSVYSLRAQGPFLGVILGPPEDGLIGAKMGLTFYGIAEASVMYNPKFAKWNNPGFVGGALKLPIRYNVFRQTENANYIFGVYGNMTAGNILLPEPAKDLDATIYTYKRKALGWAPAVGIELMRFSSRFSISIPLELGYGRMQFGQDFANKTPDPVKGFQLDNTLYMMFGIKMFFSKDRCDHYTEKLLANNYQ